MGFKVRRKILFVAPGGELQGIRMRIRSVQLGKFVELTTLAEAADDDKVDEMLRLFTEFAEHLVSWNLEYDDDDELDGPIPPDATGVMALDVDMALALVGEWMEAMGGVPAPLDTSSTSGATSPELSLPMETLSASPPS